MTFLQGLGNSMLTRNYLFLGGPKDLQTIATNGNYLVYVSEMSPGSWTMEGPESTFEQRTYRLKKMQFFGSVKSFYAYEDLSDAQAQAKFGALLSSLFDMYVDS